MTSIFSVESGPLMPNRFPIGEPFGKNRWAIDSLMTATVCDLARVLWTKAAAGDERQSHDAEEVRTDYVVSDNAISTFRRTGLAREGRTGPETLVESDERQTMPPAHPGSLLPCLQLLSATRATSDCRLSILSLTYRPAAAARFPG
jgi:hypothetical protein